MIAFTSEWHPDRLLFSLLDSDAEPDRLTRKLRSFAKLPTGWSHGEGIAVSHDAIAAAEKLTGVASLVQLKADVFPGLHGGCAIAFYFDQDLCLEVLVDPANLDVFEMHLEKGFGLDYEEVGPAEEASYTDVVAQIINLFAGDEWNLSESSLYASTTAGREGPRASYSSTLQGTLILEPLMAS